MTSTGQADTSAVVPYPSSWLNHFFDAVDRLPGPSWLFYLLLGLLLVALETALKWHDGLYPVGTFFPFHLVFAVAIMIGLWGMDDATRSSQAATKALRPMSKLNPVEHDQLEYRLRYIPPRAVFWCGLLGGLLARAFYVWLFRQIPGAKLLQGSVVGISYDAVLLLAYGFWQGSFVYVTFHLQGQIAQIYAQHVKVDLLLPQPLYALSAISTRAALVTLLVVYLWAFTLPAGPYYGLMLGIILAFGGLGLIILVLPWRGVHLRLVAEKRQRQAELGERIKATIAKLYDRADTGNFSDIDGLNKLMASLELTRQTLERASTWPWHPDTPRLMLTALLLPVVLWLAQRLLGKLIQ